MLKLARISYRQSPTSGQQTLQTSFGAVGCRDEGAAGAGPPLVFLQGFLAGPDVWSGVVGELAGMFRCVTVDWPFGAHREGMRDDADLSPPGLARLAVEVLDLLGRRQRRILRGEERSGGGEGDVGSG